MKTKVQRYTKLFYPEKVIHRAIIDYRRIADISFSEDDGYNMCTFSHCIVDPTRVMQEFGNYLIELINSGGVDTEG